MRKYPTFLDLISQNNRTEIRRRLADLEKRKELIEQFPDAIGYALFKEGERMVQLLFECGFLILEHSALRNSQNNVIDKRGFLEIAVSRNLGNVAVSLISCQPILYFEKAIQYTLNYGKADVFARIQSKFSSRFKPEIFNERVISDLFSNWNCHHQYSNTPKTEDRFIIFSDLMNQGASLGPYGDRQGWEKNKVFTDWMENVFYSQRYRSDHIGWKVLECLQNTGNLLRPEQAQQIQIWVGDNHQQKLEMFLTDWEARRLNEALPQATQVKNTLRL